MKQLSAALRGLVMDIKNELAHLQLLHTDIECVRAEIARDPAHTRLFYKNLALKLHNTSLLRIFSFNGSSNRIH